MCLFIKSAAPKFLYSTHIPNDFSAKLCLALDLLNNNQKKVCHIRYAEKAWRILRASGYWYQLERNKPGISCSWRSVFIKTEQSRRGVDTCGIYSQYDIMRRATISWQIFPPYHFWAKRMHLYVKWRRSKDFSRWENSFRLSRLANVESCYQERFFQCWQNQSHLRSGLEYIFIKDRRKRIQLSLGNCTAAVRFKLIYDGCNDRTRKKYMGYRTKNLLALSWKPMNMKRRRFICVRKPVNISIAIWGSNILLSMHKMKPSVLKHLTCLPEFAMCSFDGVEDPIHHNLLHHVYFVSDDIMQSDEIENSNSNILPLRKLLPINQ